MAAKLERTRTPGVYKRGSRYAIVFRDSEGRQRQESARSLAEARRLKAARTAAVATGEFHSASRIRFHDYARSWVERYQGRGSRGFRETTRADYRRDLERYVIPYLDGRLRRRLSQVTPADVAAFVAWLCDEREQGHMVAAERLAAETATIGSASKRGSERAEPVHLADRTIRRVLAPLRACLATAVTEGLIRSNPTIGVSLPARDPQEVVEAGLDHEQPAKAMSTEELAAFLSACPASWETFFRLLASTGLRVSEASALRWRDFELAGPAARVLVRRAYVRGSFGPPKSRHGKRAVPIANPVAEKLQLERQLSAWSGEDDLAFPASNGAPLRQENVRRRVLKPAAEKAGVPWLGFHTFRHTCATMLFAEGRSPVEVQRWLGHHSAAFTLSVYAHLLNENMGDPLHLG